MADPNITIFSGTLGIDKQQFIKNFLKRAGKTNKVFLIDFDAELLNESRNPPMAAPDMPTFLDSDDPNIKLQSIKSNYEWIASMLDGIPVGTTDIFLDMHLSYFKNSEFYPPFVPSYFDKILAKFPNSEIKIITLIDDVFAIWKKIQKRESDIYLKTQLTLREILAWRSLESLHAEALKEHISMKPGRQVKHFVVPIRHPFSTFNNLIFKNKSPRIYLSYHITSVRNNNKDIKDINDFRMEMYKLADKHGSVIFDPIIIDELAMEEALNETIAKNKSATKVTLKKSHRWDLGPLNILTDDVKFPITIPRIQIEEAIKDINNQILSRDYTLVDASLFLAVYRPRHNGRISLGVNAEVKRANSNMKKVIMYHPDDDHKRSPKMPSTHPFGNKVEHFDNKSQFITRMQKIIKEQ